MRLQRTVSSGSAPLYHNSRLTRVIVGGNLFGVSKEAVAGILEIQIWLKFVTERPPFLYMGTLLYIDSGN